ncbi:PREDICTED: transcription factor IIIB 90 kDa subunit [Theobroma cacao]|uniref:Transcription factor IIIB 90 kDa subunit n=1 Tax=Theobroma cacao TaxID=3641 RepID=A0AB32V4F1_THECC|nr:PREDICTED: transcription factor IIIB 90 kDa subunit [Theobroma cacao]
MVYCNNCSRNVSGERFYDGPLCCNFCGKVLEEYNFSSEPQFVKDSAGQSKLSGNFIKSVQDISDSRRRTLDKAFDDMRCMKDALSIDDYSDDVVETASRFYEIALERNFTRGRRTELVQASCLYLACRQKRKPFLLIDFSSYLSINVYELGSVYLQLCYVLYLADTKDLQKLIDPSIFIHKFTNVLIPEGNDEVVKTARDILASMKRDWMQTGRKPSGLCGAALYISALSHGLKCSKSDIIRVVHVCEATLTKRLVEFESTDSGSLTIEEFTEKERELRTSSLTKKQPNIGSKEASAHEVLCKHMDRKPFAYGLCEECYEEFMKVSGGLDGGSDPPAFQRAEKERIAKLSIEENANRASGSPFASGPEKPESIGVSGGTTKKAAFDEGDNDKLPGVDGSGDESDNFSDIDDLEVDGYLHNEEEKRFKKIIWEEMNREYLEEQAAKEAAAAAAKEANMANYDKCPEDLQAAQELAAAAAAVVAKSRKERQQKRAAEAKNSGPPQTAAEATRRMLARKRLSSKINYDALEKLFDEPVASSEKPKKQKNESHSDEKEDKVSKIGKEEGDLADEYNDVEGDGGGTKFDNNLDFDNEVYDYDDDYGYDEY